ncbi:putative late control protein GpD [Aeromonas phage Ahp2]|nr:putative late control protein GpD [Aeromonas phage Ahp2]
MKEGHYRVVVEGGPDITARINDRFLGLTITDAAGDDSDSFSLKLDNRDDLLKFPGTGTRLRLWIGLEGEIRDKGVFTVDEISEDLWLGDLEISGKALDTKGPIKGQKTRTWAATTLGAMGQKIASEAGYGFKCHPSLSSIKVPHTNQKAESDLNLMTRLCKKHKGIMKFGDGMMLITTKDSNETATGKPLPIVDIDDPSETKGRVTLQERGTYGAVVVTWFDAERQANIALTVKGNREGATHTLKGKYLNQDEAIAAATSYLAAQERGRATMTMDLPLTPDITAPGQVRVKNHRKTANGVWYVESATHWVGPEQASNTSLSLTTEHYDADPPK